MSKICKIKNMGESLESPKKLKDAMIQQPIFYRHHMYILYFFCYVY